MATPSGSGGAYEEDDYGYSTSYPNRYGGWHRSIYSPYYRDHLSFDTDPYDDYVYGSGHYTDRFDNRMGYDPGWGGMGGG